MFLAAWNVFHQKQHPGEQNTRERSWVSTWLVSTFLHPYQSIYSWSLSSINLFQKPSKLPNISTPPHNFFPFTPVPQRAPSTLPDLTSPQQCMIPPTPSANYPQERRHYLLQLDSAWKHLWTSQCAHGNLPANMWNRRQLFISSGTFPPENKKYVLILVSSLPLSLTFVKL